LLLQNLPSQCYCFGGEFTITKITENAAVVRKRTTPVYAEGGFNPFFKCVTVVKVSDGRPKGKDYNGCLTSAILPNMNVLAQVTITSL